MIENTLQRIYRTFCRIRPAEDGTFKSDAPKIRPGDVFVTSYPKSGNTWVRFLLANALYPNYDIDFQSIHGLIPEVGIEGEYHNADLPSSPRLWKSHSLHQDSYPKVIYIVRDGRDVYTSYYHYRSHTLPDGTSFEEFIRNEDFLWPSTWAEHVQSWLGNRISPEDNVLIVRFEDLKTDPRSELHRMLNFIGRASRPMLLMRQCERPASSTCAVSKRKKVAAIPLLTSSCAKVRRGIGRITSRPLQKPFLSSERE